MSETDLSQKLRQLRAQHKLTLEQVAQQVGVGRSTVRKWETGQIRNMGRDKIARLASALHTTPEYLMGWEEAPPEPRYKEDEILFALSRGGEGEITEAMYEEVKRFAAYIAQREAENQMK